MYQKKYFIWVDEAGRGAWAWPVIAWAFCIESDFDFDVLSWLTDSKKLTPKKREILFYQIEQLVKNGKCYAAFWESSAGIIDWVWIREANRLAMKEAIDWIFLQLIQEKNEFDYEIQIDGRDNYDFEWYPKERIKYIVRWDLTVPVISAASIIAKVTRDRKMCDFSAYCPEYQFSLHKGYGTKKHHDALLYYGIHSLHRKSYAPVKALISEKA